jgi:acyl-CoA reductase-like NAD-dependent aldehyde dehydrogenase
VTRDGMVSSSSPQRPDDVVVEVPAVSPERVAAMVGTARAAGRSWGRAPATARAAALLAAGEALAARAEEAAKLVAREVGKPIGEARAEVGRGASILHYYAQQVYDPIGELHAPSTAGLLFSQRRPRGVAGLITPWNFPVAIPLWKAAPALAYGNGVVLKPSPEATACGLWLGELLGQFLPDGLLHIAPGDVDTGTTLVDSADVVSFTGSARVGSEVARRASGRGVPVQAEMGGQNASIVLADADLERAAAQVAEAAMGYAGQKCTATRRVIVVGQPGRFLGPFVEAVRSLGFGDPEREGVAVGPVITERARQAVLAAAGEARDAGGRVLAGGAGGDGPGWFVQPTVVDGLGPDHRLAQEEVFGPICVVLPATDEAEAVRLANEVRYGLVTSIFSRDLDHVLELLDEVDTGLVKVNAPTTGVDFYLPFGGEKDSSFGPREQGKAARELYTTTRTVTIAPAAARRPG